MATTNGRSPPEELELLDDELELELLEDELELDDEEEELLLEDDELLEEPDGGGVEPPPQPTNAMDATAHTNQFEIL